MILAALSLLTHSRSLKRLSPSRPLLKVSVFRFVTTTAATSTESRPKMMNKSVSQKAIGVVLDLLQVTFAVLVVYITSAYLINVDVDVEGRSVESSCLLNGRTEGLGDEGADADVFSGTRLCVYSILVGIIACIATLIFCCLKNVTKLATCNIGGLSRFVDIIADAALFAWWLTAFIIFVRRGHEANMKNYPRETHRNALIGCAFGAFIAFAIDIGVTTWTFFG